MPSRRAVCLSLGSLAAVTGCLGGQSNEAADGTATATATRSGTASESPPSTVSATGTGTGIDGADSLVAPHGRCDGDARIVDHSFSVLGDAVGAETDEVTVSIQNDTADTTDTATASQTATAETLVLSVTGVVAEAAIGESAYLDSFGLRDGVLRFRIFPGYDTPTPTEEQTPTSYGTAMGTKYRLVVSLGTAVPEAVLVQHRRNWDRRIDIACRTA